GPNAVADSLAERLGVGKADLLMDEAGGERSGFTLSSSHLMPLLSQCRRSPRTGGDAPGARDARLPHCARRAVGVPTAILPPLRSAIQKCKTIYLPPLPRPTVALQPGRLLAPRLASLRHDSAGEESACGRARRGVDGDVREARGTAEGAPPAWYVLSHANKPE